MVHINIENLLSTCDNRPLYESLWFLAFSKNYRPEIFENESITSICNEMIKRIRNESINARSFLVSANLVFGTIRLYKVQVDKLYEQTRFALQSCRTTFYHMDWIAEMTQVTSTPIQSVKTSQKSNTQTKLSQTQTKQNKSQKKKSAELPPILDDFDIIESIYNLMETQDDDTLIAEPNRRSKKNAAIDPTMTSDVFAITMKEPPTLMSSGYNTMVIDEDDEDFGEKSGNEFESLLRDTVLSQNDVIGTTSSLLTTINSRKRSVIDTNSGVKKRRLTYMNFDETFGEARDTSVVQQGRSIDIYDQIPEPQSHNSSAFISNLNVTDEHDRDVTENNSPTMNNSSINYAAMEISNEPLPPPTPINDNSELERTLMPNVSNNGQLADESDKTLVPDVSADEPAPLLQESELILDEIPQVTTRKRIRKTKSLVLDKQKRISKEIIKRNCDSYKDKFTEVSPFQTFFTQIHYYKSCSDVLFSTGSFRLKKSKLHYLYTRNMKKIPEKVLKNSRKASGEDLDFTPKVKSSKRPTRMSKKINESSRLETELDILPLEHSPDAILKDRNEIENQMPDLTMPFEVIPDVNPQKDRPNSSILKERNELENQMPELSMPSPPKKQRISNEYEKENQPLVEDFEMPPVIERKGNCEVVVENRNQNNECDIDRLSLKKEVLGKLKKLWQQKDQSITMNKVCRGMKRTEAAGAFFEILLLAKHRAIELVQDTGNLEISNILCKIPLSQFSKKALLLKH